MRTATPEPRLTRALTGVLALLRRLEPEEDAGDRRWHGPYFVPRPREWCPSRFVLYRDELYCFIEIGWSAITLIWTVDTDLVAFDGQGGFALGYDNGPELWAEALRQIEARLRSAIANPLAYNRRVAYHLPLACRTGRIRRRLTWPEGARPSLSLRSGSVSSVRSSGAGAPAGGDG